MSKGFKELIKPKDTMEAVPADANSCPPSLCLDNKQMPDIEKWELGKEYAAKIRMTRREEQKGGRIHCCFEVVGVEGKPTKGKDDGADAAKGAD